MVWATECRLAGTSDGAANGFANPGATHPTEVGHSDSHPRTDGDYMADWIAAIGQAIGALFTAAAVAVALWIASKDRRDRSYS